MWVRSQDRTCLFPKGKLRIGVDQKSKIPYFITLDFDKIGIYKSKKRCLQILNDIQYFIQQCGFTDTDGVPYDKVYQMPEK